MKVVINTCYGGFSISFAAAELLAERGNAEAVEWVTDKRADLAEGGSTLYNSMHLYDTKRHDPLLIAVIEELGVKEASGEHACLSVVEIPDDVEYMIESYDGSEWIAEKHRTWR